MHRKGTSPKQWSHFFFSFCLINSIWFNTSGSQTWLLISITWGAITTPSLGCTPNQLNQNLWGQDPSISNF